MIKLLVDALTWAIFIALGVTGTAASVIIPVHYFPSIERRVPFQPAAVLLATLLGFVCLMGLWIVLGPYALLTRGKSATPPTTAALSA